MDNLLLAIGLSPEKNFPECHSYPASLRFLRPLQTVQFGVESVSSLRWTDCPVCRGMGVQFAVKSVSSLVWNTHQWPVCRPHATLGGQIMGIHMIHPRLLQQKVRVAVIGAGGTGSQVLNGLVRLHLALLAFGHPGGLDVTLWDDDQVSEANVGRQSFFSRRCGCL
ncbi:ThiF family adenylyltransferase [Undibacterium arcticum]